PLPVPLPMTQPPPPALAPLSLHDALPISLRDPAAGDEQGQQRDQEQRHRGARAATKGPLVHLPASSLSIHDSRYPGISPSAVIRRSSGEGRDARRRRAAPSAGEGVSG